MMGRHRLAQFLGAGLVGVVAVACGTTPRAQHTPTSGPQQSGSQSSGSQSSVMARLDALKLINYFPENAPNQAMWTEWDPAVLATDFARIRALHANAVRVTLFPQAFGYPQPTTVMLQRLQQLVQLATTAHLKVQMALFDSFSDWTNIPGSKQWAQSVLAPYANDPEIAFIDVHNELDPNVPQEVAWAKQMVPFVKSVVGKTVLVTVSKDDYLFPAAFCQLKSELAPVTPDFWDWHFYGVEGLAYGFFQQVKACASPLPLYIGETGDSTNPDGFISNLPLSPAASDAYQEYYLRVIADAARKLDLPPIGPWELTDLTTDFLQGGNIMKYYYFGLYRGNGSPKPAAAFVSSYFSGRPISQDFNANFSQSVATPSGLLPALWRLWGAGDGTLAWDNTLSRSPPASLRVSNTDANGSGMWVVPVAPHVVPRQKVTASVWAKGSKSTGYNLLAASFFDYAGVYCGDIESQTLANGDIGWTQLTASGPVPRCANYVRLYLKSTSNTGTVWFDDVQYSVQSAPKG
jgi:hypothetical protein